jgi:hypothetical protein
MNLNSHTKVHAHSHHNLRLAHSLATKDTIKVYKKRLVSRKNQSLLLKIILYDPWSLQLSLINRKLYTKDNAETSLIKNGSLIESSRLDQIKFTKF